MIFHDSYTFLLIDRSFLQTDFLKKKIGTARVPVGSIFLIFQKFVTIEIRKNYKLQKFDLLFKDDRLCYPDVIFSVAIITCGEFHIFENSSKSCRGIEWKNSSSHFRRINLRAIVTCSDLDILFWRIHILRVKK
ncbi:hypothetical protein LEP1GSC132_1417 [Leptospira kirschneri str. 200803703]|uniref:Uncharacterized protein n=1 Tax=Leptospira kirschneri str. 200802841 TaxID=1193047 RepID=A0A828Y504_9LEPT|nr:hypothetical protein [Leptospira kirschneri]EJO68417.1 hypothetical protein LEP1GSC044_0217 [Leptospira kirschneri serovar Grippotyphosa str. RM52]EKQ84808.1 hypothetical protein LEP1GSC064_2923 [Leptospira kirschneri serovar Grippotyphosa str. Moskva]EKR08520.1 hypothetical protein LEP1GSC122_1611 [Leptospira kirschneri serovar Valbuzzi str. 200702274]EMK04860.1 hypothetical protein LEP1GSC176_3728 [Leptospira kirschneri str. MMD1493]EMN26394.1 hypothetical protein LEP1GSC065_0741 [Leptosp